MIPSTTIRTVFVAGLLATLSDASATAPGARASDEVRVCLGTDDVLRFARGERCPDGERAYRLAEVEDEVGIPKGRDEPTSSVVADLEARIDFLARRVADLEENSPGVVGDPDGKGTSPIRHVANFERPVGTREAGLPTVSQVTAPFEVVDKSGRPIFVVADVRHESVARRGRIQIARALGANTFSLSIRNAAGVGVAGLGDMSQGGGLFIADGSGTARVFLSGETGLELFNSRSKGTVHLTTGPAGAGQLVLADEGGRRMVEAGTVPGDGGMGIVRVGPGFKCVPMASLRVGDCIRGRPEQ